ncbi:uncharacterized protein OCT59_019351 [Rhizophagus irregularis]|uniref:uncharacterized protein n=1 Tax=Rhizophagus irregularis TaxID=588596 RepID=UPI0033311954|nr:hypothetical protein OCT59_019351 [Rhizophagus irregularis]
MKYILTPKINTNRHLIFNESNILRETQTVPPLPPDMQELNEPSDSSFIEFLLSRLDPVYPGYPTVLVDFLTEL